MEYKFRGKDIKTRKWVYGYYAVTTRGTTYIITEFEENKQISVEVDSETVGEYTGIHDCKRTEEFPQGQEIYEGDIVSYTCRNISKEPFKCKIQYEEDASILCINGIDERSKYYYKENSVIFHKSIGEDCEIIGNIFDNPELNSSSQNK